jgi:hypothetical protein
MSNLIQPPVGGVPATRLNKDGQHADFTPVWRQLMIDIVNAINGGSGSSTSLVPATRKVLTTAPLTGGGSLSADVTIGVTGFSGTIVTAKITAGGANGSMTFTNGVLTSQVAAT